MPEGGGSSTMPQKRNPVGSALAVACARLVAADASVLTGGLAQEHERALGGWHAEWDALSRALALTGGAAAAVADLLEGSRSTGSGCARTWTRRCSPSGLVFELGIERDALEGRPLRDVLAERLSEDEVEAALDPSGYLGSAGAFVDRALAYAEENA